MAVFLPLPPLEDRFWNEFCSIIEFDRESIDEAAEPETVIQAIQSIVDQKSSSQWQDKFENCDACAVIANTLEEAVQDPHYVARGVFDRQIHSETGATVNALPMPFVNDLMNASSMDASVPKLGEHNAKFGFD